MEYNPDLISITSLMTSFPNGMDPKDAIWICRRIAAQVATAHMAGVVHGAIVPDHVLVNIESHDPVHIGWVHSMKSGDTFTHVISRWKAYYPPEVFTKKPVNVRTDIYMAGKTMIALLGGDVEKNTFPASVPKEIVSAVLKCVEKNPADRYLNGKELLDKLTEVARALWGKSFRKLVLPVIVNSFANAGGRVVD